jgi:hypothetical protein
MENTQLTPMEFEGSNGTLLVNENGSINKDSDFDNDSWLSEISKVDIEELDNYYKLQGLENARVEMFWTSVGGIRKVIIINLIEIGGWKHSTSKTLKKLK